MPLSCSLSSSSSFFLRSSLVLLAALVLLAPHARAQPREDEITNLPGLEESINFKQYSGYVEVQDPIPGNARFLHYWLVMSQSQPATDPLVLWMNGGPGCSSLLGLMTEHGPFRPQPGKRLALNPYSWNKVANMLYLEQPAGVGFSYGGNLSSGDDIAAHDNLAFLLGFFSKFPSLLSNGFYVAGESYAGQYVPQLVSKIYDYNAQGGSPRINLQGFLAGNPSGLYTHEYNYSYYSFMRQHALISPDDMEAVAAACNETENADCHTVQLEVYTRCLYGVDPYNILLPCIGNGPDINPGCAPHLSSSAILSGGLRGQTFVPCGDYNATLEYLNSPDVKAALHVSAKAFPWDLCAQNLTYSQFRSDTPSIYQRLAGHISILVYSGDLDSCVPFLGTQRAVQLLGFEEGAPWRRWMIDDDITHLKQIAGYVQSYNTGGPRNLTYATIRGAGHMVPTDRPQQALEMLRRFINGVPF